MNRLHVLILHSSDRKAADMAEALVNELVLLDCGAEIKSSADKGSTPVTTAQYDVVCVMTRFSGLLKPQLPEEMDALLRRCSRLEGKRAVALVPAKLGSGRALKALMARMEQQGMLVEDFDAVGGSGDVRPLARRIASLDPQQR